MADSDLEVKRRGDYSWHPCRVSLSDDNLDILVQFESCDDKDIISDEKDALARLRYRSVPLHSGECLDIEEGDCVLAGHEGQYGSLFFDAIVIEPQRFRHSKRVGCRCFFQIKWLNPEMEDKMSSVSSSSIRKLSKKSITSHSVLMAFFNSINLATSTSGSPPDSLLDDTIWGILEKLEETSKSTETSTKWAANNFFEATRGKLSGDALNTVTKRPNNSRRSTKRQKKHEVKMEVDKHSEDKPFVSSLAACAALASYFHDLLPNHGIVFSRQGHINPSLDVPKKHTQDHTLNPASVLLKPDTSCTSGVTNSPIQSKLNSPVNGTCSRTTRNSEKSQSSDSQQVSNLSKGGLASPPVTEHMAISPLVTDGELKCRTTRCRITRSAVQKRLIDSTTEMQDLSKETHTSLRNKVRATRSEKHNNASNSSIMLDVGIYKTNERSQVQESDDSPGGETVTECQTNPATYVKLSSCVVTPTRKCSSETENIDSTYEVAQGSSNKTRSDPVNTRLTRSTRRKDASGPSAEQQLGELNLTETLLDKPGDYIATQQKRVKITELSSSIVGSDNFSTFDGKRSTRASTSTTTNGEDQGEAVKKAQRPASMKKKAVSLKMPETGFSARVRFLPRTRSQISSPSC